MSKRIISWLLKLVVIFVLMVFVSLGTWLVPSYLHFVLYYAPEIATVVRPSVFYINLSFVPVYVCLYLAWRVFGTIAVDEGFSLPNAKRFLLAMWMALTGVASVVAFMAWATSQNGHLVSPAMGLSAVLIVLVGFSAAIVCLALYKLVGQAATLKEEAEWTI